MAIFVAFVKPSPPIMAMYAYDMARMLALPQGAADTALMAYSPPVFTTACPGRNGFSLSFTQIGPMPGPPPPCGMQNVLCRFRWHTSAPMLAGEVKPTCAFMLAPSMYTNPPLA